MVIPLPPKLARDCRICVYLHVFFPHSLHADRENQLKVGGDPILPEEVAKANGVPLPIERKGHASWLGSYIIKDMKFCKNSLGKESLKLYGANIWIETKKGTKSSTCQLSEGIDEFMSNLRILFATVCFGKALPYISRHVTRGIRSLDFCL